MNLRVRRVQQRFLFTLYYFCLFCSSYFSSMNFIHMLNRFLSTFLKSLAFLVLLLSWTIAFLNSINFCLLNPFLFKICWFTFVSWKSYIIKILNLIKSHFDLNSHLKLKVDFGDLFYRVRLSWPNITITIEFSISNSFNEFFLVLFKDADHKGTLEA